MNQYETYKRDYRIRQLMKLPFKVTHYVVLAIGWWTVITYLWR